MDFDLDAFELATFHEYTRKLEEDGFNAILAFTLSMASQSVRDANHFLLSLYNED